MKKYNIPDVDIVVCPSKYRKEKLNIDAVDVGEAIRTNTLGTINSSLLRRGLAEDTAKCPDFIEHFGMVDDEIIDAPKEEDIEK